MSLLDILASRAKRRKYQLVVAHFDHGIRVDSYLDRQLVKKVSSKYNLPFVSRQAKLGKVSEATARQARYSWLNQVKNRHKAVAIITAHHLDDALETAIFNTGRGADRWGLTPLHLQKEIIRPLLNLTKADLVKYARKRKLEWREDPTNRDLRIARNFIRGWVLPLLDRRRLTKDLQTLAESNRQLAAQLEARLANLAEVKTTSIKFQRYDLIMMDNQQLSELLRLAAAKLGGNLDSQRLRRLVVFAKTGRPGKLDLSHQLLAQNEYDTLSLVKGQSARVSVAG